MMPFPLFCITLAATPESPVKKGTLLLSIIPLLLLFCGTPLLTGRTAPFGLAKGTCPLTAGLATTPVTALAVGFDPPIMSCMKNVRGWWPSALATAAPVAEAGPAGVATASGGTLDRGASAGLSSSSSRIRAETANVVARARRSMQMMATRDLWDVIILGRGGNLRIAADDFQSCCLSMMG